MAYQSLRDWIAKTEEAGQLKRIMVEVDWDSEAEEQCWWPAGATSVY